jgi:hypothetical protein
VVVGFTTSYWILHTIFPSYLDRYVQPIVWSIYVVMALAVSRGIEAARARLGDRLFRLTGAAISAIAAVMLLLVWLKIVQQGRWLGLTCAALLVALAWAGFGMPRAGWFRRLGPWLAASMLVSASFLAGIRFMNREYVRTKWIVFRQAGEWLATSAGPDDRIVTTMPRLIAYYSGKPAQTVYAGTLRAQSADELLDELRRQGITYVVWDQGFAKPVNYDATRHKGYLLSMLREQAPDRLELVQVFHVGEEGALIYRLRPPAEAGSQS